MDTSVLIEALLALIPPVAVGGLFWVIMRSILRADSTERKVYAEMETEMRKKQAKKPAAKPKALSEQAPKKRK